MTDFNPGKAAEAAATVLADLRHKAADTLEKAGVASVLETASEKIMDAASKASDTAADAASKAGDAASEATDTIGKQAPSTATAVREWLLDFIGTIGSKTADATSKGTMATGVIESIINSVQHRAAETADSAGDAVSKSPGMRLDPDTLAQVGRFLVVVGTALTGILATRSRDAGDAAKEAITATEDAGKQRADDLSHIARVVITALAEAVVAAMQQSEARQKQAREELSARVEESAQRVADAVAEVAPAAPAAINAIVEPEAAAPVAEQKKPRVGFFRWFLLGIVAGVGLAYYRSRQDDDDMVWEQPAGTSQTNSSTSYWPGSTPATPTQAPESASEMSNGSTQSTPEASSTNTSGGDATA